MGTLFPVTSRYDVPLMSARGYSSETFAYETAEHIRATGKPAFVYYVGDFDPSGWHMSADLKRRLEGFGAHLTFERLTVTPEQVDAWQLPTRPTKESDTRHKAFYALFGGGRPSAEVDSVHPDRLRALVRKAIEQHIDQALLEAVETEEDAARRVLVRFAEAWAS
jgi:hypothetical protein